MSIRQYWFVLWELTKRELKRKYARSFLGILWSFSQAWVKSYVSHITGQRIDTVDCNTVCITVGYKNKFA